MKEFQFTSQENTDIAEFIFSEESGILIKSDAASLLNVFHEHKIIDDNEKTLMTDKVNNQIDGIVDDIKSILYENISKEQIKSIMNQYYSIKS